MNEQNCPENGGHDDRGAESLLGFGAAGTEALARKSKKLIITPFAARNAFQEELIAALRNQDMIISAGPPQIGKTYLACMGAVEALEGGKVSNILLCRPSVEAGEQPGDEAKKLVPPINPQWRELECIVGKNTLDELRRDGTIANVSFDTMRGRTFMHAFILADDMQNATYDQLKMLTTRTGEGSKIVLSGDPNGGVLAADQPGFTEVIRKMRAYVNAAHEKGSVKVAMVDFKDEIPRGGWGYDVAAFLDNCRP